MGEDSKSAPWASTTRVGSELRPGKGSHGHSASGPAPPGPAPPPPLRLQAPAPPQVVDTKDDRCLPAGTATVLRGASLSRSEQWRRLSRGPGAVTGVGGRRRRGPSPRPPPPTGREAENSSARCRHSQGSEGRVRRGSRAKEDDWGRRQRAERPQRPSPRIRPLRRTRLEPTVGRQRSTAAHPDARFLLLAPVRHFPRAASRSTPPPRLLASSPVPLRRHRPPALRHARRVQRGWAPPLPAAAAESRKGWGTSA